jgi:SRSO17 transposase
MKWELALGLLRNVLAAGLTITTVVTDAGFGDVAAFRAALHAAQLA